MNPLDVTSALMDGPGVEVGTCAKCGSRSVGLCAPLNAAALDEMAGDSHLRTLQRRSSIFDQGEPATSVFTLTTGIARLTRSLADGRHAVIGFRYAGDLVGYTPLAEYPHGADMLTEGTVCRMERGRLEGMFRKYPLLERRLIDLCHVELASTQEHLVALGRFRAEDRVAAFLISLAEAQERRGNPGPVFAMPATRGDVGDFLGLSVETVSRTISRFQRQGWIKLPGRAAVELTQRSKLMALATGDET